MSNRYDKESPWSSTYLQNVDVPRGVSGRIYYRMTVQRVVFHIGLSGVVHC